jgi:hypothetical protein
MLEFISCISFPIKNMATHVGQFDQILSSDMDRQELMERTMEKIKGVIDSAESLCTCDDNANAIVKLTEQELEQLVSLIESLRDN